MTTAKDEVRKILDSLPEDIQYHLYVLQKIEQGRQDIREGRVIAHDEVEQRMARWLDK